MFWVFMIAMMLFLRIDDVIDLYKSKNPSYQKEQELKAKEKSKEKIELLNLLHEHHNMDCVISFNNMMLLSKYSDKLMGKIMTVEDNWLEIETGKAHKRKRIILKIDDISTVSKII